MAKCSVSDLMAEAACFCGATPNGLEQIKIALLCKLWQQNDPMVQCNVTNLLASAKCYDCLTPHQLDILQTQLLCEILQSGGGSGNSCLLCVTVDPTETPDCACAIYYNTANGTFWIWDASLVQWSVLIST